MTLKSYLREISAARRLRGYIGDRVYVPSAKVKFGARSPWSAKTKLLSRYWDPRQRLGAKLQELPDHFKRRWFEKITRVPTAVHWQPNPNKWERDAETGMVHAVENIPIPVIYPQEADEGLWGGDGVIKGFVEKRHHRRQYLALHPNFWWPRLSREVFYSEILDKWMIITVTDTTLDLIDEACGFDNYLLKTHEDDLHSQLGIKLKRDLLLALARKSLYPDNPAEQKRILEKYEKYIMPEDEAEWVGLTMREALAKHLDRQDEEARQNLRPLKEVYQEELIQQLTDEKMSRKDNTKDSAKSSWIPAMKNPFKKNQSKQKTDT